MAYFQTIEAKHDACSTIVTLKQAVLSMDQGLVAYVKMFQALLESVGTPETVECTLNHLKNFKAQALMYYIRGYEKNFLTAPETLQHLQLAIADILLPIHGEGPLTTQILSKNDIYLENRFRELLNLLDSFGDTTNICMQLHNEFDLHSFQESFCKFLDKIENSLQHSSDFEVCQLQEQ